MQSAFVDIGLEKAAFLHAADVLSGFDYSIFVGIAIGVLCLGAIGMFIIREWKTAR